ncbi:DUF5615 family PIN-like protein [Bradyrhizobium yuanmingense]|uniref:DUF5615 family PIN-like protein n=1 Tax=Bradyrhizobium yuanmingense TaxID=108015 RepID=UPI000A2F1693
MRRAGYDAAHVAEFGMANATDGAIWNEAASRSAILVTKDRDFSLLRAAKRQGPIVLEATAQRVGQRHGKPHIFKVDAGSMHAKGFKFFRAENGVWLTDHVPPEFLA